MEIILDTINNDLLTKPKLKTNKKKGKTSNKIKNKVKTKSEQQQQRDKKQQANKKKTSGARKELNQQFNFLLKDFNHNRQGTEKTSRHSSTTSRMTKGTAQHFLNPEKIGVLIHTNALKQGKGGQGSYYYYNYNISSNLKLD